jgi:hypothetical protein
MSNLRRTLRDKVSATLIPAALLALATVLMASSCPPKNPPDPPPAAPVLLGVLDRTCAELPPGTPGGFRLLPQDEVRLRVAAAWPGSLAVAANGTALEEADTPARELTLKNAGMGYWQVRNIDPNPSPTVWAIDVQLPPSMRQGPVTLTVVSRVGSQSSSPLSVPVVTDMTATAAAPNRVVLGWRDRGDEMGYLLERSVSGGPHSPLVSLGRDATSYTDTQTTGNRQYSYRLTAQFCGPSQTGFSRSQVDVTTPAAPGVEEITLFRSNDPGDDQFVYKLPLLLFMPQGARITGVTNVSTDRNNNNTVKLELVRHTDANGVMRSLGPAACPAAPLEPQASTSAFNGLTVQGDWKVRAVCISQVFLDPPARIALRISWTP